MNLKPGNDDGDISFKSDHLIHCGHQLHVMLSKLFNTKLIHGHILSILLKSTILLIQIDYKGSLSSSDDYRRLSLFNSIFNYTIMQFYIYLEMNSLHQKCNLELKSHTPLLYTVRFFYRNKSTYAIHRSSVYSCLLDTSKAFDLVYYGKLFKILLTKDIPRRVTSLCFDNYLRQISCVVWSDYKSVYFKFQME